MGTSAQALSTSGVKWNSRLCVIWSSSSVCPSASCSSPIGCASAIVGLLLTGVIVGPYGLRLVHDIEVVESLAEVGIILLLFTIGIEFSLHTLLSLKRIVGIAGTLQVGLVWPLLMRGPTARAIRQRSGVVGIPGGPE